MAIETNCRMTAFSFTPVKGNGVICNFLSGNRAIRDHALNGKDLHLFKQGRKSFVRYVGQMVCTGWQYSVAPDTQGKERKAIVFELGPIEGFTQVEGTGQSEAHELDHESLEALRQKALADSVLARTPAERKAVWRRRSRAIKLYVLKRASGKCEGCDTPAPFKSAQNAASQRKDPNCPLLKRL